MISKEAFLNKIKAEVFPALIQAEQDRKKALRQWVITHGVVPAVFLVFVVLGFHQIMPFSIGAIAPVVYIVFVLVFFGALAWSQSFIRDQKDKLAPLFLRFLGNLTPDAGTITKPLLTHSCLFGKFTDMKYDDSISGTFDNTQFSAMELDLSIPYNKGRLTVFKGICIDIPMKTHISGYTLLYNTQIPKRVPVLQPVKLEDISISGQYQIFSDNQLEARVLLTPLFIERLNNLKKCFNNKRIDVAFFGDHALFAIHTNQNLFEPFSLFKKTTNLEAYARYYDEIKSIYDLTKILYINNEMFPGDFSFNKKLYKQISTVKKSRLNYYEWLRILILFIFVIFFVIQFIWPTISK